MKFQIPDGEDTLIRYISSIEKQISGSYTLQELAEEKIDKNDFVLCLMDTTIRKSSNGSLTTESERYLPHDDALLASLQEFVEEEHLVERAEDYLDLKRPRKEAVQTDAFTIEVTYQSGRQLYLDQESKTNVPRETFLPTGILQWADTVFTEAENEATE